jgi:competence protein ComGC
MTKHNSRRAFVLIEVMVIIAILGLLVSIAIPMYRNYLEKAYAKACLAERETVNKMILLYSSENSNTPLTNLAQLVSAGTMRALPLCPQGGEYMLIPGTDNSGYPAVGCSLHYWPEADAPLPLPPADTAAKYFTYISSTGKITGYDTSGGADVIIPSRINGTSVMMIGHAAFMNKHLSSVSIPGTVNNIATNAFHTNNLGSIVIPESVTSIGANAFLYNKLTNVTIPGNVTSIGDSAFAYNALRSVTILSKVTSFGTYAFSFQDNPNKLIIYGYKGSTAEAYAKLRGYVFNPLNK